MTQPGMIPFRKPTPPKPEETPLDRAMKAIEALTTQVGALATAQATQGQQLGQLIQGLTPPPRQPERPERSDPMEFKDPTEEEVAEKPVESIRRLAAAEVDKRMRSAQPAVNSSYAAHIRLLKGELRERNPGLYDFVKDDFEKFLALMPPEALVQENPQDGTTGIGNAFDLVVGRNHGRYIEALKKMPKTEPDERRRVPYTELPGTREQPEVTADDRLTAEEKEVAETMGISAEEYAAGKKLSVITTPDLSKLRG